MGQGQTADLHPKCCLLIISFDPMLDGSQTRFTGYFGEKIIPIAFWGHKVKRNY